MTIEFTEAETRELLIRAHPRTWYERSSCSIRVLPVELDAIWRHLMARAEPCRCSRHPH